MADTTAYFQLSGDGLPADVDVVRYRAREAVSQPFEVIIELATGDGGFEVEKCLRKSYLLTVVDALGRERVFHGVCDRAEFIDLIGEDSGKFRMYHRLTLRPALWALRYIEDCRIWQNKSVIDVFMDVLTSSGIEASKIALSTTKAYEPREFCVQYRESRFAFVSRLMEDEGIFYFFRHSPDGHAMVIGDDPSVFAPSDEAPEVVFAMSASLGVGGEPLADFARTRSLRTSNVVLKDYDFKNPQSAPLATVPA